MRPTADPTALVTKRQYPAWQEVELYVFLEMRRRSLTDRIRSRKTAREDGKIDVQTSGGVDVCESFVVKSA